MPTYNDDQYNVYPLDLLPGWAVAADHSGVLHQPSLQLANSPLTWEQFAPLMQHYESGGRNVPNYTFDPGHTASGIDQITNSTWNQYADKVGVPKLEWPQTPMDRPIDEQDRVGKAIFDAEGPGPWANYNPRLAAAIGFKIGGKGLPQGQLAAAARGAAVPTSLPNSLFTPQTTEEAAEPPTPTQVLPPVQGARGANPLLALQILSAIMSKTHQFTPVDYDPFATVRKVG